MSMLHPDIASIDPKTATPEDLEKLLSDPLYRSLQYQIQHGVQNIELETNQGKQKINNICVPEGEDQEAFLQKVMAEENRNKERKTKEEARKKEKEKQERLKKSDPYELIIEGAGLEKVNGTYRRDGEAVRNGGRVFKGPNGFSLSFECVSGGEGWILGKTPRAYYANQTKDKVPPIEPEGWMVQEHGKKPVPTVRVVEPLDVVMRIKAAGNDAFKEANHQLAIDKYSEALSLANACAGATGIDDDVYGKLHGNRAEAHLQVGNYDATIEDADLALEYDPCFIKAFVRKAKAAYALEKYDVASQCLQDAIEVAPGNKEVLSMQDEYRVAGLARAGNDQVLTDVHGLCTRLAALLKRRGTAAEVIAIFKQLPSLLTALKLVDDVGNIGDCAYESAPNYDAQVYFRMETQNFALLAPLIRPLPKQPELLMECLEALGAALRDCASNQVAFDKYVPQLVPLLRAKATLPYELLKATVKVLSTMAHRVAARKIMFDPDSAEGVMHVLSHPDSSQSRPATHIIRAIDELKDMTTLATLLGVPDACDIFWRESHSRREDIRTPARSILARAFGHSVCRKRLRVVERLKRLVGLFEQLIEKESTVETWDVGDPEAFDPDQLMLRDLTLLPPESARVLTALVKGAALECAADPEIAEGLHRLGVWQHLASALFARPPLSGAAIKLLRAMMSHSQKVVDRSVELGLPAWLLQCREQSDASDDFNANVRTTLMAQDARDDLCQVLGFVANQGPFHAAIDAFDNAFVLRRMCEVLAGNPTDDAACGGCRALEWLVKYNSYARLPTLRPVDLHDVVIPVWLHKEDAAKDAAGKALRHILSNVQYMEKIASPYFEERGSASKLNQVIQEMNQFEALKEMRTTGKRQDQLRPGGQPLESQLESEARRENLNPPKVVELLARDLSPDATIVDCGAGTGMFTFPFALAMPQASVHAYEVRTDALQVLHAKVRKEGIANVTVARMAEDGLPRLPEGRKAALVFLCDVLDFVPEGVKEGYLLSLRAALAEGGRLISIESRDHWETHLVDIQDAGFVQTRIPQIVSNRRIMAFEADPAADAPPPPKEPPAAQAEDTEEPPKPEPPKPPTVPAAAPPPRELSDEEKFNQRANASGYDPSDYGQRREPPRARVEEVVEEEDDDDECLLEDNPGPGGAAGVDDDDDDDDGCMLEENPSGVGGAAADDDDANDDDDDGCMLEENEGGGAANASAEVDSDDDGCMLEDN